MSDPPRIGISACLLGQPVRFDGQHKRDRFLVRASDKVLAAVSFQPSAFSENTRFRGAEH